MAKAIMVQGTMSNVGKSLLTAGLCRIFRQDGFRVAPFKSQNMALNSFITKDGDEIGRAQVMQAEAAAIEPSVLMNPVLLKPTSDSGSQVIVNGRAVTQMPAQEYYRFKKQLVPEIQRAYNQLAQQVDIVVLEGAGSPAEINLKHDDIVNMGMAKMAKAPVLLVGDIDRGGVFASLYGTLALLTPEEQVMVKGLIINKFRGDEALLRPGLTMLEELTKKQVLGVVPYTRIELDDEDSLSERLERREAPAPIDIAVIRLPRLSNFTDFSALEQVAGVGVRYVTAVRQLREPDMVILPGTKNTIQDLAWLRESGLESAIQKLSAKGVPVFGICGGYQMLGESVSDPLGSETGGHIRGLGLLPGHTVFEAEKVRTRVNGTVNTLSGVFAGLSGAALWGYEIHMGHTESSAPPLCHIAEQAGGKAPDGGFSENVYGTYVHGFFDSPQVSSGIVRALMERKGLDPAQLQSKDFAAWKEEEYDRLAQVLRRHLNMDEIYRILEEGL